MWLRDMCGARMVMVLNDTTTAQENEWNFNICTEMVERKKNEKKNQQNNKNDSEKCVYT